MVNAGWQCDTHRANKLAAIRPRGWTCRACGGEVVGREGSLGRSQEVQKGDLRRH
jgi:hypothetical protein